MDYTEMILRAIEYIEQNLKNEMHLDDIADAAYCSSFHFHRLFKQVVGDTPGNYIRKRRLTEAARELKDSDKRILDIAIEYGFESQASFSYAFKNQHFVSPGLFRKGKLSSLYFLKRFTRQNLMNYRGVRMTEPKIIKKEAIKFVGVVCVADTKDLSGIEDIYVNLKKNILAAVNRKDREYVYGICFHDPDYTAKTGRFNYMVAVETESLDTIPLEAGAYLSDGKRAGREADNGQTSSCPFARLARLRATGKSERQAAKRIHSPCGTYPQGSRYR